MPGGLIRVSELADCYDMRREERPAERLLHHLGIPQSVDTVLRILKRDVDRRKKPVVRVAGIDDWS